MKAIPEFRPEQLALPANLPVHAHAEALIRSIAENPVTIVCGATGSGKSTQLPKLALRAGRQSIAHTQPRRLAARTLAERIATEMQCAVGTAVGWQVRFAQALSAETCVKLVTDGVLLSELRHDPKLRRYDTIIIDEAHERSLNIDFLLGCLHRLLRQRPELRLIITSATLDAEKFSAHFDGAPVFEVEGRGYPVEIRYLEPEGGDLQAGVVQALRALWKEGPGDVLVFLPGEREIRDLRDSLSRAPELSRYSEAEFLPLYARLPSAQQQRIFNPTRSGRRVILATNVAETSLTVPGIRYVIDSGLARIARFSPRTQLQSLAIEAVAQDASAQRAGRCGRTAPGICIRLYPEEDFASRPAETVPEILRSNLGDVVLQMADRRLGQAEDFPFVDPPDNRLLRDARRLLLQLQALREDGRLTPTGKQMARLPVEPRFARMLVEAARTACLDEVVIIVAALSMPDVRDIGPESREAAAQLQADWKDKSSDFHGLLRMHAAIRAARE
ncbi:MAG: helicase-related protein, partial [Oceanococcaceae bacterium]